MDDVERFNEGGVWVLLNASPKTEKDSTLEVGIDLHSWIIGPKFMGIKMIPGGLHFIYYSVISKEGAIGTRCGFFHYFKPKDFIVQKWNALKEEVEYENDAEINQRIKTRVRDFEPQLGAYPQDNAADLWLKLTNFITVSLLENLQPLSRIFEPEHDKNRPRFTPFNLKDSVPLSLCSDPAMITKYGIDKSLLLDKIIQENYAENDVDLLGEFQFAYICFLIAHDFTAFEQWKNLLELMCSCEEALAKRKKLFLHWLDTLQSQLVQCPPELFNDLIAMIGGEGSIFLQKALQNLTSNIRNVQPPIDSLSHRIFEFRQFVTDKFGIIIEGQDCDFEIGEDAPIVVSEYVE